ncbi:MAG: excinuclease ABC subunit UvrC [Gemmatimonadota bacterium]
MKPRSTDRREALRTQLEHLPTRPGVYLFRDAAGHLLYVGKAKSLRGRVRSYFGTEPDRSVKLRQLARQIASVETIVVDSEAEALLLESNLIKEHGPRFNIQLRDDKSYPYVKITLGEPFPRILVTRRLERDGSRYFGPFTDVGAMRRALRTIRRMYTVRTCHYDLPTVAPERPCLDYHIGRCKAPCVGYQSESEYREMIGEIAEVLAGHTAPVKATVRDRMTAASRTLDFEAAAELRDVLRGLEAIERRQTAIDFRGGDRDVLGVSREGGVACGVVMRVREGRLLGSEVHHLRNVEGEEMERVVEAFLKTFYLRREDLPPELLVPTDFPDRSLLEEVLAARRGASFSIRVPRRGGKRRLAELAAANAAHLLAERQAVEAARPIAAAPAAARALASALELPEPPRALLCFDVSTLGGAESVGSAVWLEDGAPRKSEYRRFRVRGAVDGKPDDYAMMQEIVGRYFHRRVGEGKRLPDLVIVDGGKGQLGAARQGMASAGITDLPVVALAKREEELFRPGAEAPLRLGRRDPALQWIQRTRDEAHRFALAYNRSLRKRRTLRSGLAEVPGVGPAREERLLRRFGSVAAIREASPEEIADTPGIGPATAAHIRAHLRGERGAREPAHPEPKTPRARRRNTDEDRAGTETEREARKARRRRGGAPAEKTG